MKDYNIILINLDGFREDRIDSCLKLKSFKDRSFYFSEMNTVAPYTFAALHAIFSGMYPSRNGVNAYYNMFKFKKNEIITIPQFLQKAGYYTSCDIISPSAMPRQGYDEWNQFDESTVDFETRHKDLIKRLSKKEKFFLFLHYTEVHKHLVREIVQKYKQKVNRGIPLKGPYFPRMPDRLVRRTIRGMLPYKKDKGRNAFKRIMCYIGVPEDCKDKQLVKIDGADIGKLDNYNYIHVKEISKELGTSGRRRRRSPSWCSGVAVGDEEARPGDCLPD